MEEALRTLLKTTAAVSAIVGTRVTWGDRRQGAGLPALVLNRVSGQSPKTLKGPTTLDQGAVQIDCYADTYGAAKLLARAVIARLDGYRGGGFRGVFHQSTRDGRIGGTNEPDRPFRVILEFTTHWRDP